MSQFRLRGGRGQLHVGGVWSPSEHVISMNEENHQVEAEKRGEYFRKKKREIQDL